MKLICKCGQSFNSLIIDRNLAMEAIYTQLMNHVGKSHVDWIAKLQPQTANAAKALVLVMTIDNFAVVPESEEILLEEIEKCEGLVMSAIGYDPKEEEENAGTDGETDKASESTVEKTN